MASREPWSERSGSDKRTLLGRFGVLYLLISLAGFGLGWTLVGVIFGVGAIGLAIAWFVIPDEPDADTEPEQRAKPDWLRAMDDPNTPDLTRPEYRDGPPAEADTSATDLDSTELPATPPEAPPSPTS